MIRQKNLDMENQFRDSTPSVKQINADDDELDEEITPN